MKLKWILSLGTTLFAIAAAQAHVELPALFSDNMVLQQSKTIPVWGWADEGEKITVTFRNFTYHAVAHNKHWSVRLPAQKPGEPTEFTVTSDSGTVKFTNVVVGEVWLCGGQSNMELPMQRSFDSTNDILAATNQNIRLFKVPNNRTATPTALIKSSWQLSSPENVKFFSAVGYYFGRALQTNRHVPIGLIASYWGGTPAESWTDRRELEIDPYYTDMLVTESNQLAEWQESIYGAKIDAAISATNEVKFTKKPMGHPWVTGELHNGMIAPLVGFPIRGAIWYQGESNAGRAEQYRHLFPDMIRSWRHEWAQDDFPFLCVQIAPFDLSRNRSLEVITNEFAESAWAELREAQLLTAKTMTNVGLVVITDLGDKDDIHPTHKQPVGERLARMAEAMAYHEERYEYSGPIFNSSQTNGSKIEITFNHVGAGLEARNGDLTGFAICGPDKKFVHADAVITGKNTVAVSSPAVPQPIAVRYGWADYPVVNLWNKDGLPASPFRTDDFPMITAGKTPNLK